MSVASVHPPQVTKRLKACYYLLQQDYRLGMSECASCFPDLRFVSPYLSGPHAQPRKGKVGLSVSGQEKPLVMSKYCFHCSCVRQWEHVTGDFHRGTSTFWYFYFPVEIRIGIPSDTSIYSLCVRARHISVHHHIAKYTLYTLIHRKAVVEPPCLSLLETSRCPSASIGGYIWGQAAPSRWRQPSMMRMPICIQQLPRIPELPFTSSLSALLFIFLFLRCWRVGVC